MLRPRVGAYVAAAVLAAVPLSSGADDIADDTVRIKLAEGMGPVEIHPESPSVVADLETGERRALEPGKTYYARPSGDGLKFGEYPVGSRLRYAPEKADGLVRLGDRRYRGTILIERTADGELRVINELGLEEYLYSVLPNEMSPDWPLEALKAQAVISRTYALKSLGRYEEDGYDLHDDVKSQVYRGVDTEEPRSRRAVDETAGQVLAYRGALVSTHFHACCGGHTRSVARAWSGKASRLKPLQGVPDGFCAGSPHYRWTRVVPAEAVLAALPSDGRKPRAVRKAAVSRRERSGWVQTLQFSTDKGVIPVNAAQLRNFLGPDLMRSTHITRVSIEKKGVRFSGRGWGHGVGLCQWGTRLQAKKGRRYMNILKFYYPGTKVVTWRSSN